MQNIVIAMVIGVVILLFLIAIIAYLLDRQNERRSDKSLILIFFCIFSLIVVFSLWLYTEKNKNEKIEEFY